MAFSDLGAYMGLAQWYATTTDALAEGSTNKYFTTNRVATALAATTTDAIAEGSTNLYYTPERDIRFSTTSASYFTSLGLGFSTTSASYNLESYDKGFFFSTTSVNYWESTQGRWATTSTDYWKTQNNFFSTTSSNFWSSVGLGHSTTSANYWSSVGLGYSTTSTDYWKTQNNFFSTTSASNFSSLGLAFSTTSSSYFLLQNQTAAFSTTSTDYYQQSSTTVVTSYKNNSFTGTNSFQNITATGATTTSLSTGIASTSLLVISNVRNALLSTSANGTVQSTSFSGPLSYNTGTLTLAQGTALQDGYLTLGDWFTFNSKLSTTSLSLFDKGYFFSTTSASHFASAGLGFSTTSADYHLVASSSIPKTYSTNTFIGVNNFANITAAGATTTTLFSTTASSTNIFATAARFGSLSGFSLSGALAAAGNSITGVNIASSTDLWISGIRDGLLATNGQGNVVASSTPTASSFNATSQTSASQLPFASTTQLSALQQISIGAANGTILQGAVNGTSTVAGFVNVTGANSTSTFSGGLTAARFDATATSTFAGINLNGGCVAMNGTCTVSSLTATNTSLTVSPNNGAVGISLNLANPNLWTGLQQFGNATTSLLEATQFYARTIQSTSSNALVLKSNFSSTAGLTFGSTSTPQVLGIDTINNRVTLGTGGGTPSLLVLDNKNTPGDPTGTAGGQYYNSNTGEYRCFVTSWMTCGGQAASSTGNVQYRNIDGSFTANANFSWLIGANTLVLTGASSTQTTYLLAIASSSGRTMFGINGMGVLSLSSTTDPIAPATGEVNIYAKEIAGRMLPKWIGPSGVDTPFQANLGFNRTAMMMPAGGNTAATFIGGYGSTFTNVVTTANNPTPITTNLLTSTRRATFTTSAIANTI
ncbi:MAG TPA: hypothetical protein VM260_05660, partial [Pirellula sp.]|nr:hypothetical protein [Pirellula sp.]